MLAAHNISVLRNGQKIVDRVSLEVQHRDFITIVGPNGAGKTTLLQCLMGVLTPDSGTVVRRDADMRIGYVPQLVHIDPVLPVRVRDFVRLNKACPAEDIARAVELCGIGDVLARPLHQLSGGERQRVLLARAIVDKPQLLILDEPSQNLDISGQLNFYRLLQDLHKEREMSVLTVSHDLHFVLACTRRVVCMYHHICCQGEPHIITQDPEFIRMFGQDMTQMMAVYSHDFGRGHRHGQ